MYLYCHSFLTSQGQRPLRSAHLLSKCWTYFLTRMLSLLVGHSYSITWSRNNKNSVIHVILSYSSVKSFHCWGTCLFHLPAPRHIDRLNASWRELTANSIILQIATALFVLSSPIPKDLCQHLSHMDQSYQTEYKRLLSYVCCVNWWTHF